MLTKVQEFIRIIDDIYGVYLDSTNGFDTIRNNFIKIQKYHNVSEEELQEKRVYYGKGNPNKKTLIHYIIALKRNLKKEMK